MLNKVASTFSNLIYPLAGAGAGFSLCLILQAHHRVHAVSHFKTPTHRTPASMSFMTEGRSESTDFCYYDCESDHSVAPELVQAYNTLKDQKPDIDYNKLVPKNLQSSDDPTGIANKIADTSVQYWWNDSGVKSTPIGHSVTQVEDSLKKDVDLGGTEKKQKLNFSVDAFQSQARMKYEGYGNGEVIYRASDASITMQMVEKVGKSQDVTLGVRPNDQSEQLTYKLAW